MYVKTCLGEVNPERILVYVFYKKGSYYIKGEELLTNESGIYMFVNLVNNKKYIGQSKNIKKRIKYNHLCDYKNPNSSNYNYSWFYAAIRKYGEDNFEIKILEKCPIEKLNEKEIYWITYYNTFKNGYNKTRGGRDMPPGTFTEESKNKMIKSLKQNPNIYGENHHAAKLTNKEVVKIRQRFIEGDSISQIYDDYKNIYKNIDNIRDIIYGKTYAKAGNVPSKEIIEQYLEKNERKAKITNEEANLIRKRYLNGETIKDIFKDYCNIYKKPQSIKNIILGKRYKNVESKNLILKCQEEYEIRKT